MKIKIQQHVLGNIIDFIGIIDHSKVSCQAFSKKGKKCKTKINKGYVFCRKHQQFIIKLANGDSIKEIAVAYLLMSYKGPNRKKITSNGIISKKVQEVPLWVGGKNKYNCYGDYFYDKKLYKLHMNKWYGSRSTKPGYCMCPWCIEQYFKFFNRYSDRIIHIRKIICLYGYPYNSIIDLFNNNILKINETNQKRNKKNIWLQFSMNSMIPKKRLLGQYNPDGKFYSGTPEIFKFEWDTPFHPLKMVANSYSKCADNTQSSSTINGFSGIFKTQYIKETKWRDNYERLQRVCPEVALASYEMINVVLLKKILKNYTLLLPDDIIRNIMSYFYDKKTYKKSFLHKKRIYYWKPNDIQETELPEILIKYWRRVSTK